MKNFYEILGVSEEASADEIKNSYRKLAMQYHPDRNPNNAAAEEKFKEVNEAYETLSDSAKKQNYDHVRKYGNQPFGGFSDFMQDIFGHNFRRQHVHVNDQGQDIQMQIKCTYKESITGVTKKIKLQSSSVCGVCDGSGNKYGKSQQNSNMSRCVECNGFGRVVKSKSMGQNIMMQTEIVCPRCSGSGKYVHPNDRCKNCNDGLVYIDGQLDIVIPPKIVYGTSLRIMGHGLHRSAKSRKGDLYLQVLPDEDEFYKLDNNLNLHLDLSITMTEAILGTKITIPTIDDKKQIIVPAGVEHGHQIVLHNQGVYGKHGRNSLLINIRIETPKMNDNLKNQAEILKQYENSETNPATFKMREKMNTCL